MMIAPSLLAPALLVAFSAPTLAFHCPADVNAIDNAPPKSNLIPAEGRCDEAS